MQILIIIKKEWGKNHFTALYNRDAAEATLNRTHKWELKYMARG